MGNVQCPYCKNISYVPSKFEGRERPCAACGRLFVRTASAEISPEPIETVPNLIIDEGGANGNIESISEQSSAPVDYRAGVSDMNSSFKYKRTSVKLVLIYVGVFLFLIFCGYLTYRVHSRKIDKPKIERSEIPLAPPGFEPLAELGEFDFQDSTAAAQKVIPTTQLSASWSIDKEYNKSWQQFTNEERSEFDALVEKTVSKLTRGVEINGGVLTIERPPTGMYAGSVIGCWEVFYDDKYDSGNSEVPHRWNVQFNAHKIVSETPSINVFISQCIIAGEK